MCKLKIIIPALVIICGLVWWLMPHFSDEDKAHYIALYCLAPGGSEQQSLKRMQKIVEGNNQDYALKKRHYAPQLAAYVVKAWHSLSVDQQQQAQQKDACRQLLAEKLLVKATY